MKRIWEYISARAEFVLSAKQVMLATTIAVGLFHTCLLFFFAWFRIYPLVAVNLCSILIYIYCFMRVRHGTSSLYVFNMAFIEIVVHSTIATILMGIDSGFALYLIAMIPIGYFAAYNFRHKKRSVNPMLYVFLAGVGFCITRIVCFTVEPFYTYGNKQVDRVVYMINYFITVIAIVAFFSSLLNQIRILEEVRLRQNKQLEVLSMTDPLTGLSNRRSLEERYQQSEKLKEEYAIIMGDIDDFKKINDTYGHDIGDKVLKAVAEIFKESVRSNDIVCRWGGEEILIFLPRCTKEDAIVIAHRILNNIRKFDFDALDHSVFHVTMTLGVSVSFEAEGFEEVMREADKRLYDGKHLGKNQVVCG